jgi:hypothetical protein
LKKVLRNVLRSSWVQRAVGLLAAEYLRLVWLTNKFSFDPPGVYGIVEPQMPAIFAFWHGQHFMTPFIKTKESHRAKVLISRHRDGEFNAIAAERLGIGTIRGSGDHGGAFHRKGGVGAFREMRDDASGLPSPMVTLGPTNANGPITTPGPSVAPRSTMAVGWTHGRASRLSGSGSTAPVTRAQVPVSRSTSGIAFDNT